MQRAIACEATLLVLLAAGACSEEPLFPPEKPQTRDEPAPVLVEPPPLSQELKKGIASRIPG